MPDWYPLIKAAKYLQVAPWDLADQPPEWIAWAQAAAWAEAEAQPRAKPPLAGGGGFRGLGR